MYYVIYIYNFIYNTIINFFVEITLIFLWRRVWCVFSLSYNTSAIPAFRYLSCSASSDNWLRCTLCTANLQLSSLTFFWPLVYIDIKNKSYI